MCVSTAGAYLLSIAWGGYQVPGSPFKVSVGCCNDASKVTVTGPGLDGGALGQDLCVTVDTRRAGSGIIFKLLYNTVSHKSILPNHQR